jgi:hypothetical protein
MRQEPKFQVHLPFAYLRFLNAKSITQQDLERQDSGSGARG